MSKPHARNARKDRNGHTVVTFEGGYAVIFVPNTGGHGALQHVEAIKLRKGRRMLAVFHSPYQYPINQRPFGFQRVRTREASLAFITLYFEAAYEYVKQRARRHQSAWDVVYLAEREIKEIANGDFPLS